MEYRKLNTFLGTFCKTNVKKLYNMLIRMLQMRKSFKNTFYFQHFYPIFILKVIKKNIYFLRLLWINRKKDSISFGFCVFFSLYDYCSLYIYKYIFSISLSLFLSPFLSLFLSQLYFSYNLIPSDILFIFLSLIYWIFTFYYYYASIQ